MEVVFSSRVNDEWENKVKVKIFDLSQPLLNVHFLDLYVLHGHNDFTIAQLQILGSWNH